jgi:[citrate (pro-3S)-lyase] ligase
MSHRVLKKFRKKLFEQLFPTYSKKYMESKRKLVEAERRLAKSERQLTAAKKLPGNQELLVMLADILSDKLSYYNANLLVLEITRKDCVPFFKMLPEMSELAKVQGTGLVAALRGRENVGTVKKYYNDLPDSDEDIYEVYNCLNTTAFWGNSLVLLSDATLKFCNVVDHVRVTADVPAVFDKQIHFFGNCWAVGRYAEDAYTPASFLQRLLNANPINGRAYKVINNSIGGGGIRGLYRTIIQILHPRYVFSSGDIAVILTHLSFAHWRERYNNIFVYEAAGLFDGVEPGTDIFFDGYHTNHRGYELAAKKIFKIIQQFENTPPPQPMPASSLNADLDNYVATLRKSRFFTETNNGQAVIGSIVMNCNPFTLGHEYLITKALENCDYLYIFLVEEDKSAFPFDHRKVMVLSTLAGRDRVSIVPGGRFILSNATLPEYFTKDANQDVVLDASADLTIFATKIAPALGITKRFVGREPFDNITRQYNEAMKSTLPRHGIELIEIPRLEMDGRAISASEVRACLKSGDLARIARMVPPATYDYLMEHYIGNAENMDRLYNRK